MASTEGRGLMANQLAMDKVQPIKGLAAAGSSARQIVQTLGISRKAVQRHLGRTHRKDTKAPPGKAPTGSRGGRRCMLDVCFRQACKSPGGP